MQPKSSLKKNGRHQTVLPPKQQSGGARPSKKLLNVTVTVLSISGLHIEETGKKTSYFNRGGNSGKSERGRGTSRSRGRSRSRGGSVVRSLSRGRSKSASRGGSSKDGQPQRRGRSQSKKRVKPVENSAPKSLADVTDSTLVVASFARTSVTKKGGPSKKVTHVPSFPITLVPPPPPPINVDDGKSTKSSSSSAATFNDIVSWPDKTLNSFAFQRHFPVEPLSATNANPRYVPQMCPIDVSLLRNGEMHKLGSAKVYVGGEENGVASTNVPIVIDKGGGHRGMAMIRGNNSNGGSSSGAEVTMTKLKGEPNIKCGLSERATLRVLIQVSDPESPVQIIKKALSFEKEPTVIRKQKKVQVHEPSFFSRVCCCCQG